MGYSQTVILVLGVELSNEQAKRIFENCIQESGGIDYEEADCITDEIVYKDVFKERNVPEMLADGADSRVDDMSYCDELGRHVIGVTLASRGYGGSERIEDHFGNVQQKAYDNFNKYILPILVEEGIDEKPELLIVSQVW